MKRFIFMIALLGVMCTQSCDSIASAQYKTFKYDVGENTTVVVSDRSMEADGYYIYDLSIWRDGVTKLCSSSGLDGFVKQDTKSLAESFYKQYQEQGCE